MGEYFRGWKRKLGLVTLTMACVLMSCWVRSQSVGNSFGIPGRNCIYSLHSDIKGLYCGYSWYADGRDLSERMQPTWNTYRTPSAGKIVNHRDISYSQWAGFRYEEQASDITSQHWRMWTVPYWSIVIPSALLSAYLLLSRPSEPRHLPHTSVHERFSSQFKNSPVPDRIEQLIETVGQAPLTNQNSDDFQQRR